MAARIMKDPAASKALLSQFSKIQAAQSGGDEGTKKNANEVLDEIYANLKKQFEHIDTPIGDKDE